MRYIYTPTGAILDTDCELIGDDWALETEEETATETATEEPKMTKKASKAKK